MSSAENVMNRLHSKAKVCQILHNLQQHHKLQCEERVKLRET